MTDREDQKPEPRWWDTSSAYRKANEDIEFLNRDEVFILVFHHCVIVFHLSPYRCIRLASHACFFTIPW